MEAMLKIVFNVLQWRRLVKKYIWMGINFVINIFCHNFSALIFVNNLKLKK